jgi:UDP-N-acetylglucosamine 4,6-dehydratase
MPSPVLVGGSTKPNGSLLITGGTGSLGRALVRAVLAAGTYERVCVYSRDEFKQFALQEEIRDPRLRCFLGDVRDLERLRVALEGVDDVIHAAALKWVASGGYNPTEIRRTNVDGTEHVVRAAIETGARRVIVISSDKAVHPANIYGKSKAMAEEIAVSLNSYGFPRGTRIGCVRYGNVLWSRGSVAYRFRDMIRAWQPSKPVQLTDRRMTRFGIRMSAAVAFVLTALERLRGGEVFVPRLPSFRVEDVVYAMWREVYGSEWARRLRDRDEGRNACVGGGPYRDELVDITGKRAGGEKLHEMLLSEEESLHSVWAGDRWVIEPEIMSWTRPRWDGEPVAEGSTVTSDKSADWMSEQDLIDSFRELEQPLVSV